MTDLDRLFYRMGFRLLPWWDDTDREWTVVCDENLMELCRTLDLERFADAFGLRKADQ